MWTCADKRLVVKEEARSSSLHPCAHCPASHSIPIMLTELAFSPWVLLSWPHCVPAQGHITWEQCHMAPALPCFWGRAPGWLRCPHVPS